MATVVLNLYTKAYPSISNRIRASVYAQSDPQALIASQIDAATGHPARTWTFPGLPRNNYGFSLDEIDVSGNPVNNLALFDVEPSEVDGEIVRGDEQIRVGVTTGFNTGATGFTFDGTGGKPDYRGWEIVPSELTGRGILALGLDYSWDSVNGIFALLQTGDILQAMTIYNIHFDPQINPQGNSYPTITDFGINLITADTTLDSTYFGNKLICEPAGDMITVTLPNISTVPDGRKLMVEVSGNVGQVGVGEFNKSVRFIQYGSDTINFLRGNIYICPNESISIYRYTRSVGVYEWRCCDADGNFKTVGMPLGDESIYTQVFNRQLLDGSSVNVTSYARLYNEIVLNLPSSQVVNYDDWTEAYNSTTQYKYSLANSSNPMYTGQFHLPNRLNMYERNSNNGKSGDYQGWQQITHNHEGTIASITPTVFGEGVSVRTIGKYGGIQVSKTDLTGPPVNADGTPSPNLGTDEIRVQSTSINKYVLL